MFELCTGEGGGGVTQLSTALRALVLICPKKTAEEANSLRFCGRVNLKSSSKQFK